MQRFFEIDSLRGIAVIAMIAFHALFDLNYFAGFSFSINSGVLLGIGRFAACTFIFLVGVSLTLSYSRAKTEKAGFELFRKYLSRGAKIFSLGLVITAATWLLFPAEFIVFGVLHFIGAAIALSFPLIRRRKASLLLAIVLIPLGLWLNSLGSDLPFLFWLGLKPSGFYTLDYFPLLPWLGVVLLGVFFGNTLYKNGERQFRIYDLSKNRLAGFFSFLGRHSLIIYFLHQPVLLLLIFLLA